MRRNLTNEDTHACNHVLSQHNCSTVCPPHISLRPYCDVPILICISIPPSAPFVVAAFISRAKRFDTAAAVLPKRRRRRINARWLGSSLEADIRRLQRRRRMLRRLHHEKAQNSSLYSQRFAIDSADRPGSWVVATAATAAAPFEAKSTPIHSDRRRTNPNASLGAGVGDQKGRRRCGRMGRVWRVLRHHTRT